MHLHSEQLAAIGIQWPFRFLAVLSELRNQEQPKEPTQHKNNNLMQKNKHSTTILTNITIYKKNW